LKPDVKNTFRVVVADFNEPPLDVAPIVGDIVHNLRSCLDHLIYELAFLGTRGGTRKPMPQRNAFPCSRTKANWNGLYVRETLLAGVLEKHRALLYRAQPCHGRQDTTDPKILKRRSFSAFEDLNNLWNDDKHRMLQPVAMLPSKVSHVILGSTDCIPGEPRVNADFLYRPMKLDAEVLTISFLPTGHHPHVNVNVHVACEIGFGHGLPVMEPLAFISIKVEELLWRFEREFETPVARKLWGLPRGGWIESAPRRRRRIDPDESGP